MRRVLLSAVACGALAACSGGGSALNTGPAATTKIIITTAGQSAPRVLAGSSIALSAVSTSGSNNGTVENNHYIWSATLVNGASYPAGGAGANKPCASVTAATGGGAFAPYAPDYSIYVTIDPSNESNIIFSPPLLISVPAGTVLGPLSPTNAYCAVITATQGAMSGSVVVAIADPQNPLE